MLQGTILQKITERATAGALFVLVAGTTLGLACGDNGSTGTGGAGTTSSATDASSPASSSGTTGSSGCATLDCDDGFSCTVDSCAAGTCLHTIGPNSGATACPQGTYCELESGCIAAPACATTADCLTAWMGQPCKANIQCDPASSLCTFDPLDKDQDGHSPQVCGGNDCNDDAKSVHPGAEEKCNGVDDDCNGMVDDGATCDELEACTSGTCTCLPEHTCGITCVDKQTDIDNCGACDHPCDLYETCVGGNCECEAPNIVCGGTCVYPVFDTQHCGGCDTVCPPDATCEVGKCTCLNPSKTLCGGACVDVKSDPMNCGMCDHPCSPNSPCDNGVCGCPGGMALCGGVCINVVDDPLNCGMCNKVCPVGMVCVSGNCDFGAGTGAGGGP